MLMRGAGATRAVRWEVLDGVRSGVYRDHCPIGRMSGSSSDRITGDRMWRTIGQKMSASAKFGVTGDRSQLHERGPTMADGGRKSGSRSGTPETPPTSTFSSIVHSLREMLDFVQRAKWRAAAGFAHP